MAGSNAALASHTLAPLVTLRTPPALQAAAVARVLITGRVVTSALEAAAAAPPARRAQAGSVVLVTARYWVALARTVTRRRPPAGIAVARACLWVAPSVGAAVAGEFTATTPVVRLALAHTSVRLTLAIGMARAGLPAVRAPVLAWAAGAALGSEESRFTSAETWLHAHLVFPAGIGPLTDGDGAFPIFLPPAWTALELGGAVASTDVLPGWV